MIPKVESKISVSAKKGKAMLDFFFFLAYGLFYPGSRRILPAFFEQITGVSERVMQTLDHHFWRGAPSLPRAPFDNALMAPFTSHRHHLITP